MKPLSSDFGKFLADIREERDALETDFQTRIKAVLQEGTAAERSRAVAECWREAMAAEDRWHARLASPHPPQATPFASGWEGMNRLAGFDVFDKSDVD